jgi:hypothetical protein
MQFMINIVEIINKQMITFLLDIILLSSNLKRTNIYENRSTGIRLVRENVFLSLNKYKSICD